MLLTTGVASRILFCCSVQTMTHRWVSIMSPVRKGIDAILDDRVSAVGAIPLSIQSRLTFSCCPLGTMSLSLQLERNFFFTLLSTSECVTGPQFFLTLVCSGSLASVHSHKPASPCRVSASCYTSLHVFFWFKSAITVVRACCQLL